MSKKLSKLMESVSIQKIGLKTPEQIEFNFCTNNINQEFVFDKEAEIYVFKLMEKLIKFLLSFSFEDIELGISQYLTNKEVITDFIRAGKREIKKQQFPPVLNTGNEQTRFITGIVYYVLDMLKDYPITVEVEFEEDGNEKDVKFIITKNMMMDFIKSDSYLSSLIKDLKKNI